MVTVETLHPAKARKLAARMPPAAQHEVVLRPLGGGDARSLVVTSSAQDFLTALFDDLKAADWRARLDRMRRRRVSGDGVLALSQPMHRRFQVALFEAYCDRPGRPRLDPARIASSGIVVRRVRGGRREGWMKRGKAIEGWTVLPRPDLDPDPRRAAATHPANAGVLTALARRNGPPLPPAAEAVHALYPAPPEVCEALGRTVLFGVIPVVSTEKSDLPPPGLDYRRLPAGERAQIVDHLSGYLKTRPETPLPRAGAELSPDWNVLDPATQAKDSRLAQLGTFLYQAMVELDALGPSRASADLMRVLGEIRLPVAESRGRVTATVDAAEFVRRAGPTLIGRERPARTFRMPLRWPAVPAALGERLVAAALACLSEQHKARVGAPGKFADDNDRYIVRGFVRVAGHDECPDRLVWSTESEPFRIAPWWDGEGPGTTVALPDLGNLKKVKPSVAFAMPPAIANLLKGNMKDLAEGEGSTDGPEVAWICSFSIPFITICAFIVLNIFLTLFDIIFRWLLFIRVCIPIPKPPAPPSSGDSG